MLNSCQHGNSVYVYSAQAGEPSEQISYSAAYALAVWAAIFVTGDVISESAPSKGAAYENARSARSFPGPQQLYSNLVNELEAVTPKQHFPKH
jgi:hypothetical protein